MPSILPNYEYDIFISYRHNDNKRDKWVTHFVQALKDELEATLKNPVSIYFDENPHDGLLETHQVGASLEKKLKCLVFIPIISQTYCDPEGYAWANEFHPFLAMADSDELGMNITLKNGNVASRVLPIRIHDLDIEDRNLLEDTLSGHLRSIDFIYQEPGVNRPLNPQDKKEDNLNKSSYHNQINKVANALKELGQAMLQGADVNKKDIQPQGLPSSRSRKPIKYRLTALVVGLILTLSYLGYNYLPSASSEPNLDRSIAVLPFTKINSGEKIDALAFGLHDELLTQLSKMGELHVTSRTSVMEYATTSKNISEIADELGVSYILEGSIQQSDNRFRLNVQLISGEEDDHLWAEIFDMELNANNIFQIQSQIASSIAEKLKMNLSSLNSENKPPTSSLEALQLYNLGIQSRQNNPQKSIQRFEEALLIDPNYHKARAALVRALSLTFKGTPDSLALKEKAYEELVKLNELCNDDHIKLMASAYYNYYALGDFRNTYDKLLRGDNSNPEVAEGISYLARRLGDWETYFDYAENVALKKDPRNPSVLSDLSLTAALAKKSSKALLYINRALNYSEDPVLKDLKFNLLVSNLGNIEEARKFLLDEKPTLRTTQVAVWQYWLDYFDKNYAAIINPEYEVPKGLAISNGDYTNLLPLPSDLFLAQGYWLMGESQKSEEQVNMFGQQYIDYHSATDCTLSSGQDFYAQEAMKHIARGNALIFIGKPEEAVLEARHAVELYGPQIDAIQGVFVIGHAARILAMSKNKIEALDMAENLLSGTSWFSVEILKNDPIYDYYRELDEYKKIIAKYD